MGWRNYDYFREHARRYNLKCKTENCKNMIGKYTNKTGYCWACTRRINFMSGKPLNTNLGR